MRFLLAAALLQQLASGFTDVSALKIGAPTVIGELDLAKLKGELRKVSWSPDGSQLYIETAEGKPPSEKLRHYTIGRAGGAVTTLDAEPDWAAAYWSTKSDRAAPGIGSLMIDVEQKLESMKIGTGSAGAIEGGDRTGGGTVMSGNNIDREAQRQQQRVVRFKLFDETVSEFVNERPVPGYMFSWGPEKSGAIAYTDRDGRLTLLDRQKRKQSVNAAKEAVLPAWSLDGARLAWAQKSGRRKYTLVYADVGR